MTEPPVARDPEDSPVKAATKIKRRRISSSSDEDKPVSSTSAKASPTSIQTPVKRERSSEEIKVIKEEKETEVPVAAVKEEKEAEEKKKPVKRTASKSEKKMPSLKEKEKKAQVASPKVKKEAVVTSEDKEQDEVDDDNDDDDNDKESADSPEEKKKPEPKDKEQSETKPKPINPFERTVKIQNAGQGLAGADYDPSSKKYDPIKSAFWKRGEKWVKK